MLGGKWKTRKIFTKIYDSKGLLSLIYEFLKSIKYEYLNKKNKESI